MTTAEITCLNGDPLVDGNVYWVQSRNLCVAVLRDGRYFTGVREKFGERYLDTEVLNSPTTLGTVRPLAIVGRLPLEMCAIKGWRSGQKPNLEWKYNQALFDYLESVWPTDKWWAKPYPWEAEQ